MSIGPWTCDTCAQPVDTTDGLVTWDDAVGSGPSGFRIVHKGACDRGSMGSLNIDRLIGADGLVRLTSWLSLGPVKVAQSQGAPVPPPDLDGYVDLVRRLHVDGYERVRSRYQEADVQEDFADAGEALPYLQESISNL